MKAWWEELRQQYRPQTVKQLIIGESAPVGGTFFYSANSVLFRRTFEAFREVYGDRCGTGEGFLCWFAGQGWWLLDLCDAPVNGLPNPERRRIGRESAPHLASKLKGLHPELVLVTPLSIERNVDRALRDAGLDEVQAAYLPFPQMGWETEFRASLVEILKSLSG